MKRIVTLLLAALMCLCLFACAKDKGNMDEVGGADSSESNSKPTENAGGEKEPVTRPDVPVSNQLEDFTIRIDGLAYQLPWDLELFLDDGWTPKSGYLLEDDYEVGAGEKINVAMHKSDKEILVSVGAYYPEGGKYAGGIAYRLYSESGSTAQVELAGLKLDDNLTTADLFSVFGENYTYSQFDGDRYVYRFEGKGTYIFSFEDDHLTYWEMKIYDEAIT